MVVNVFLRLALAVAIKLMPVLEVLLCQKQQQFEKLPQAFLNVDSLYANGVHNSLYQEVHLCCKLTNMNNKKKIFSKLAHIKK
jgi:hypothetical protein